MSAAQYEAPRLRVQPAPAGDDALGTLLTLLGELRDGVQQLVGVAADKLAAIRTADTAGLRDCTVREEELLRRVLGAQRQRDALLARVAQGLPGEGAGAPTLGLLAERLGEPAASQLRARQAALRAAALELQRKNRVLAGVAQNLQAHIRGIFADVANAARESVVYGAGGRQEAGRPTFWVDAVG